MVWARGNFSWLHLSCVLGAVLGLAASVAKPYACAQAPSKSKVQVVGLTICQKDANNQYGESMVRGIQAGTQIHLRIENKGAQMLKVVGDGKTEIAIKDSVGKTLKVDENHNVAFFSQMAEDGHSVIVPIAAEEVPSKDATHLHLQGNVIISCGADAKTEAYDVALKTDSEIQLGPVSAKVTNVGEGFEADSSSVTLESKQAFDQIQSIAVVDAKGKEIPCEVGSTSSFGFGGDMTHSRDFRFAAKAEDIAKVKVTYFQETSAITVPVDVKVGLGLGSGE